MENKKININKLKDMDESLRLLSLYYEKKDIIDVYLYDLIACVIISYLNKKKRIKSSQELDKSILSAINKVDKHDEIHILGQDLEELLSEIDRKRISDKLFELVLLKYEVKEKEIDTKYKLNAHTTEEKELSYLEKNYNYLLLKNENINEYLKLYYESTYSNKEVINETNIYNNKIKDNEELFKPKSR